MRTAAHAPGMAWLWAALTAVVLSGCGTTVPLQGAGAAAGDGVNGPQPAQASVPAGGSTGGGGTGGSLATSTSGEAGPRQTAAPLGQVPGATQSVQPGQTRLPPIEIGSYYLEGGSAAVAAAGFASLVIPDNKPLFDAMVKHLNAHGGLGGRQIRTVWFKYVSNGDPQTQDAAACATFTQDHHVYLVIGGISSGANALGPCLTKHGVPLIGANGGGDARYFAKNHRFIYEPGQASFTRGLAALVNNQQAAGWFAGTHKIGVVQYEGATFDNAVDDGLIATLARLGHTVAFRVKYSGTDNNTIAQGSANAVLKFNTEHVDRVIFMGPGGAAATYFMNAASTQGYHPLYGIWSADSPYVLGITAAKDQLANATGIGYQPGLDVASGQDPTAKTPTAKACLAFWNSVGQTDHSALNNPLQRATCDIFSTLVRAVSAGADTTTSTAALESGYDAIAGSYAPAGVFSIRFRAGSHDAASGYRRLVYENGCQCFAYTGSTRPLP